MLINETHYFITPYLHIRLRPRAFTFIDQTHWIKQSDFSSEQLNIACLSAVVTFAIFYSLSMKGLIKIYYFSFKFPPLTKYKIFNFHCIDFFSVFCMSFEIN